MYKTKYIKFAFDILQGIWRERGLFEQHKPELDNGAYDQSMCNRPAQVFRGKI